MSKKNIHRILEILKPYRNSIVLLLILTLLNVLIQLIYPILFRDVLDKGLVNKNFLFVIKTILIGGILTLFIGSFSLSYSYIENLINQKLTLNIQNDLYKHIHTLSMDFFSSENIGQTISRVTGDTNMFSGIISITITTIKNIIIFIGYTCLLFYFHPVLSFITILTGTLIIIPSTIIGKKLRILYEEIFKTTAELFSIIQEALYGIEIIKAFVKEKYEVERFSQKNKEIFDKRLKVFKMTLISNPLNNLIGLINVGIILLYGGYEVYIGKMTIGTLMAFLTTARSLFSPIYSLSNCYQTLQSSLASIKRVFEIFDTKPTIKNVENPVIINKLKEKIEFCNVSFKYKNSNPVIINLSLKIHKGEKIAIVGKSGAGKSTIIKLILRFYDPDNGDIFIDNNNLKNIDIFKWRDSIGFVTQETLLFNNTIKENIRYGKINASLDEIYNSALISCSYEFISNFPDKYDSNIGDRGSKLSGGQKQRIAIARALIKNPEILILDEATSNIDIKTEKEIFDNLIKLNKTIIIITQRLTTIQNFDRIIVIENGNIIEEGNHNELIKKEGIYFKQYQLIQKS